MSVPERGQGPVEALELEMASLHVAQAASTVRILCESLPSEPEFQNALGLVSEYLHQCAEDLSEMHRRHSLVREATS
jgi:hypothetical protein